MLRDCVRFLPARLRFNCCCAPVLHPLQLLLAACVRFSCCSRLRPFQLLPYCVRFGCCSPIASASTLLPNSVRFVCCSPICDCVRFNCCSPIAPASSAAPRLRPLQLLLPYCVRFGCCSPPAVTSGRFRPCPLFSNIILCGVQVQKYEVRGSL